VEIRTLGELIGWTRQLHKHLAECMKHCTGHNEQEQAKALLGYLSKHESQMERIIEEFEDTAAPRILRTYIYDYLVHKPIETHRTCQGHYANLTFEEICKEVLDYHIQVIDLYRSLEARVDLPAAQELLSALLALEEHEAMRLARQTGWMRDLYL